MIAAQTTITKVSQHTFTIDGSSVFKDGKRYMPLPITQPEWLRLIESAYQTGRVDVLADLMATTSSSQDARLQGKAAPNDPILTGCDPRGDDRLLAALDLRDESRTTPAVDYSPKGHGCMEGEG